MSDRKSFSPTGCLQSQKLADHYLYVLGHDFPLKLFFYNSNFVGSQGKPLTPGLFIDLLPLENIYLV